MNLAKLLDQAALALSNPELAKLVRKLPDDDLADVVRRNDGVRRFVVMALVQDELGAARPEPKARTARPPKTTDARRPPKRQKNERSASGGDLHDRIVKAVEEGASNAREIAEVVGMHRTGLGPHLRMLRDAGRLTVENEGTRAARWNVAAA